MAGLLIYDFRLKERLLRSFDSLDFAPHFALNGRASRGRPFFAIATKGGQPRLKRRS